MLTVTILIHRRLTQAIRQTLSIPSSPVNQILSSFYFLRTQAPEIFSDKILYSKEENPSCLSSRIEKPPKGESAGRAFQSWKFPEKMLESKEEENPSCLSYMIEKLPKGESAGSAFQSWKFPEKMLESKEEENPSCSSYMVEKLPKGESDGSDFQSWKFPEKMLESKEEENPSCLSFMIEKLPKGESVGSAFQSWMGHGFPIHRGEIFHAINRLRKLKRNKRALEVMEWLIREKPYRPKELDYSYLLEFTTKIHGISQGERLFCCVPSEFQNDLLYNNLVISCLDKGSIRLSLAYMKKMRELGHPISHLVFNRLIILHSSPSRKKMIPKILTQMKADKVAPHVSTYNILMKMEANEHNIEGLMKIYSDMNRANVEPNEISYCIIATAHAVARLYTVAEVYIEAVEKSVTGNNWSTLDVLLILYGYLGKRKELERIWGIVQELPHVRSKSYILAIEAFGRIGQLSQAEEIWLEMKSLKVLKSSEQFNCIISVYCKHGLIDKASELFMEMEMTGCEPNAITYRHLALGCLKAELVGEALKTLDLGMDLITTKRVRNSTPWLETTLSIVELFAEKGDVVNVEKFFEELTKARYTRYTFVYNTLLKAYVKAKKYDPNFLRRMILGGSRPDAETYSLMKLAEQFRS